MPKHRAMPVHTGVVGSSQDQSWSQKMVLPRGRTSQRRPEETVCDATAIEDIPSGARKEAGRGEGCVCFFEE